MASKSHVTTLTLDLGRIRENLNAVKSHLQNTGGVNPGIIAVIKGFGYGTDDTVLAKLYAEEGVNYLAVAYVEEGIQLRDSGAKGQIMVLNPDPSTFDMMGKYRLEPCIISMEHLNEYLAWVERSGSKLQPVHLNFNSGMHRLGFGENEVRAVAAAIKNVSGLMLGTVYTHLASTESEEHDQKTLRQLKKFKAMCEVLKEEFKGLSALSEFKTHSLNSSGVVRFPEHGMDYVRVGLSLLGSELSRLEIALKPAVFFKTVITQIQTVPAGEGVGYGYADSSINEREIAWLPVGYADGYPRSLSDGKGRVAVVGHIAPVIGRVCMDLTAVDVTGLNVKVGDEVELFGDYVSIENVSSAADTIPYELIARIHQRVIRKVV
ncbi:MAG: alanine racemase [Crocinitomicaceae bacterium]|nr:alanine racemase [Crocinitomicaceae bacterium]